MAVARLEFIVDYFSDALVGGYTSAAAIHALSSQIATLLGLKVRKTSSGVGHLFVVCTYLFVAVNNEGFFPIDSSFTSELMVVFANSSKILLL